MNGNIISIRVLRKTNTSRGSVAFLRKIQKRETVDEPGKMDGCPGQTAKNE